MAEMFKRLKNLINGPAQEKSHVLGPPDDGLYQVISDASRCVQCGICGYNCPVGIEVREYARRGQNVTDSQCISCGECIVKCPRGTLRWGAAILLQQSRTLEICPDELPSTL